MSFRYRSTRLPIRSLFILVAARNLFVRALSFVCLSGSDQISDQIADLVIIQALKNIKKKIDIMLK